MQENCLAAGKRGVGRSAGGTTSTPVTITPSTNNHLINRVIGVRIAVRITSSFGGLRASSNGKPGHKSFEIPSSGFALETTTLGLQSMAKSEMALMARTQLATHPQVIDSFSLTAW